MSTREALIELLKVIEKGGGALALSRGVDLGQMSYCAKLTAAIEIAEAELERPQVTRITLPRHLTATPIPASIDQPVTRTLTRSWDGKYPWDEPFTLYPDRYKHRLADVAEAIWMHYSGASDPLPDCELAELVDWLKRRLDNWMPGASWSQDYDSAWRILANQCLARARSEEE